MASKRRFIYFILVSFLVLDITLFVTWKQLQVKNQSRNSTPLNVANIISTERNLYEYINQYGIDSTLDIIKNSLKDEQISIARCHNLVHLVGHKAYSLFPNDLDKLSNYHQTLCGGAFQHGIEAEITSNHDDPINILHEFCGLTLQKRNGDFCYHGAGHAYLQKSRDINKSLQFCNSLLDGPLKDPANCYRGVFSEYAFQIDGIDGDTGNRISVGPTMKLPTKYPMDYCQSLDDKYHESCASQLSRIIFSSIRVEDPLKECNSQSYSLVVQAGCLKIVSAVIAQREFTDTDTVKVPSYILSLSDPLKIAYVRGIAGEYQAFLDSGVEKNWRSICNSFKVQTDIQKCAELFGGG